MFNTSTSTDNDLAASTFLILTFSTQEYGLQGGGIGHGATGEPLLCPKEALRRRVMHLIQQDTPADTPLARFKSPRGHWINVTPTKITAHLKATIKLFAGNHLGFTHHDVSARSLRAAGAMALLYLSVYHNIISLIGRWRSNKMMRYLHVQSEPIMRNFFKLMISYGNYNLLPHTDVPLY